MRGHARTVVALEEPDCVFPHSFCFERVHDFSNTRVEVVDHRRVCVVRMSGEDMVECECDDACMRANVCMHLSRQLNIDASSE
jgi:hypothetical protein